MTSRLLLRGSSVFRRPAMLTAILVGCLHASRCGQRSIWRKRIDVFIYNIHILTFHFTPNTDVTSRKSYLHLEYPVYLKHNNSSCSWSSYLHCEFSAEFSHTEIFELLWITSRQWVRLDISESVLEVVTRTKVQPTNRNRHTHIQTWRNIFKICLRPTVTLNINYNKECSKGVNHFNYRHREFETRVLTSVHFILGKRMNHDDFISLTY